MLREHLGVERWQVTGGSWGSALALAYAERHPDRVTGMVSWGVNSARRSEFDWLFRGGVGVFFPEQWERLANGVPDEFRDIDVVGAYARMVVRPRPGGPGACGVRMVPLGVEGRFDFQAPLGSAWAVQRGWPGSELVVVDNAGHDAGAPGIEREIVRATDRFASR